MKKIQEAVIGTDARRDKTATQKAIQAYKYTKSENVSQDIAAGMFGTSRQQIGLVSKIIEGAGITTVELLLEGKKVSIEGRQGTASLVAIVNNIKENEKKIQREHTSQEREHIREDANPYQSAIHTERGKKEFAIIMDTMSSNIRDGLSSAVITSLIKLMNMEFKATEN